jgi:hypothetical protein
LEARDLELSGSRRAVQDKPRRTVAPKVQFEIDDSTDDANVTLRLESGVRQNYRVGAFPVLNASALVDFIKLTRPVLGWFGRVEFQAMQVAVNLNDSDRIDLEDPRVDGISGHGG